MTLRFYQVSQEYIKHLQKIDPQIRNSNGNSGGKRIYVGILLTIGNVDFIAPLTSYKIKQDKIKPSTLTVFKLHQKDKIENKLGMIQLGNMFPVLHDEIREVDFSDQKILYNRLLSNQYEFITSQKTNILNKAIKLYSHVITNTNPDDFYCKFSCDFTKLLANYRTFVRPIGTVPTF